MKDLLRRGDIVFRAIDRETRTAEFVASTEIPVPIGGGEVEVLRADGCNLKRFAKNPVFLDTHNRDSIDCVLGKVQVVIDRAARQVVSRVTYAKTPRAQLAWELVDGGFVRAVSVGYMPTKWRWLRDGEVDGEGEAQVAGPGIVISEWELYELSQCPVPADENALLRRRSLCPSGQEGSMSLPEKPSIYAATMPAPGTLADATRATPAAATLVPPAAPASAVPAPAGSPAAPATPAAPAVEIEAERSARIAEARKREIQLIAPPHLRELGEALILEGVDVDTARKRLLAEHQRRSAPVGTPEPPEAIKKSQAEKELEAAKSSLSKATSEDLTRALGPG